MVNQWFGPTQSTWHLVCCKVGAVAHTYYTAITESILQVTDAYKNEARCTYRVKLNHFDNRFSPRLIEALSSAGRTSPLEIVTLQNHQALTPCRADNMISWSEQLQVWIQCILQALHLVGPNIHCRTSGLHSDAKPEAASLQQYALTSSEEFPWAICSCKPQAVWCSVHCEIMLHGT